MNNAVEIAFILDEGFVIPTSVAITSLVKNKNKDTNYNIYLIASNLSDYSIDKFYKYSSKSIAINIIKSDSIKYKNYHQFDSKKPCCASISALLKFELPNLLPDLDKILYLDGDIIVKKDLSILYKTNLDDNYAAVVKDSGCIYYHSSESIKNLKNYFNSGVMLLNLKKMREHNMPEKLLDAKRNSSDMSLMDQNIFNILFENHVKFMDIKYNFLLLNLTRAQKKYNMKQLNAMFSSNYSNIKEIEENAAIIHFSSKDKPWKYSNIIGAKEWFKYYKKSYFYNKENKIQTLKKEHSDNLVCSPIKENIQNVLSIKNEGIRKVITIFGIKFKFKSKKLIEREKYRKLDKRISRLENNIKDIKKKLKAPNDENDLIKSINN